jgi:hypothetical protein
MLKAVYLQSSQGFLDEIWSQSLVAFLMWYHTTYFKRLMPDNDVTNATKNFVSSQKSMAMSGNFVHALVVYQL